MGKKRDVRQEEPPKEIQDITVDVWGYGFRPEGSKWMAYKASMHGVQDLSPPGGEQLHSAIAKIQDGLRREVSGANRRKS